jgi:hypothetical protein
VKPVPHARRRSDHSSAFATRPPGRSLSRVIRQNRVLLPRGVPLPVRPQRNLAGRRRSSLVRRPTALMGFQLALSRALRRFDPADGWMRFASPCCSRTMRPTGPGVLRRTVSRVGIRRFRRSGPTCRLPPLVHAPIDFRRRDRPPVEKLAFYLSDRPGMRPRFDFWASAPVCGPPARPRGLVGDPALGFASRRVVGHARRLTTLPRVQPAGLDPGSGSPASAFPPPAPACAAGGEFRYPLMGFRRRARCGFPAPNCAADPFSVLMGLMPVRPDSGLASRSQADSLSEVPHRP